MRFITSMCILCCVVSVVACKPTAKFQVRGTTHSDAVHNLDTLETRECDADNPDILACKLWDQSIETFEVKFDDEAQDFKIGIIEFNDDGVVNEQQLEQTINLLETMNCETSKLNNPDFRTINCEDPTPEQIEKLETEIKPFAPSSFRSLDAETRNLYERDLRIDTAPLVILFAHGWHHGAQVCDGNLTCFRSVLHGIKLNNPHRVVMGIYLGWRGESSDSKLNQLTLFSRKSIAQRIGKRDALRTLLEIDKVVEEEELSMITVGHSLGAALIFTAVQYKLVTEVERKKNGKVKRKKLVRPIGSPQNYQRGFGDLIVLVNPAIEAYEFEPFHNDCRPRIGRPEMIVVASTADNAVGMAFPPSRVVQYLWRPNHILRGGSNLKGMGRYSNHVTHTLRSKSLKNKNPEDDEQKPCGCKYSYAGLGGTDLNLELEPIFENGQVVSRANSEFWVVETDESVIESHNDIYNKNFIEFLTSIVNGKSETSQPTDAWIETPQVESQKGSRTREYDAHCEQKT